MTAPFVVFSLPRSRSTWLSVFLGAPDAVVAHDLGPQVSSPAEFAWRLTNDFVGTCETGAAFAWRLIRRLVPGVRFAVVRRDPASVIASLERFGLTGYGPEMEARMAALAEISAQPETLTIDFASLSDERACAELYRHCVGKPPPPLWWRHLDPINIQVDMTRQLEFLRAHGLRITAVKDEARRLQADV